jgi:hypothetical protein
LAFGLDNLYYNWRIHVGILKSLNSLQGVKDGDGFEVALVDSNLSGCST